MRNMQDIKNIYFVGIGGIGMSALARFFKHLGYAVAGYDARKTELTVQLESEGISIVYDDKVSDFHKKLDKDNTLVVLTPAIKESNILSYFQENGFEISKRAEVLGRLVNNYPLIAIAGTHGKTTTSAITAHILKEAGKLLAGFVGGIVKNYNSNLILGDNKEGYIVVEADEYDRSFLSLHPDIAVITTIDADHLDIYGDYNCIKSAFEEFVSGTKQGAKVILNEDINLNTSGKTVYKYGLSAKSDFYVSEVKHEQGKQSVKYCLGSDTVSADLHMPGKANLLNSLAAAGVAYSTGIDTLTIGKAISSFAGVKRRFDIVWQKGNQVIIEDYAHHPREIEALLQAAKEFYPGKEITVVFQPHLFSRTRDFADDFAKVLSRFDKVIITDIYPAREKPIEGIDGQMLASKSGDKAVYVPKDKLAGYLLDEPFDVLLLVGAGDIDMIVDNLKKGLQ